MKSLLSLLTVAMVLTVAVGQNLDIRVDPGNPEFDSDIVREILEVILDQANLSDKEILQQGMNGLFE